MSEISSSDTFIMRLHHDFHPAYRGSRPRVEEFSVPVRFYWTLAHPASGYYFDGES